MAWLTGRINCGYAMAPHLSIYECQSSVQLLCNLSFYNATRSLAQMTVKKIITGQSGFCGRRIGISNMIY